jgi:hypothetical protein
MIASAFGLRDQAAERGRRHDHRHGRHAEHHAGGERHERARHRHESTGDEQQREHGGGYGVEFAPTAEKVDERLRNVKLHALARVSARSVP